MKEYLYKVSAAGRVNIIGEHVDYCGGKVLPCALSLNNAVYVRPNDSDRINIKWTTLKEEASIPLDRLSDFASQKYVKYIVGCAYLWQQAGHRLSGCDMKLDCTVPFGSGLSSSAAIEVSVLAALATLAREPIDKKEIALLAQQAEQRFAGVMCGIMDQFVSAHGKKGHALLLDCKTLNYDYIPIALADCALVVIDSCKPHDLVESKYNERRSETEEALRLLQSKLRVSCLADVSSEQLKRCANLLPPVIFKRARHVVTECERVRLAVTALKNGYPAAVGSALNASHRSLSEDYEVAGKELDALARIAQAHPACFGSRMTGAGFGGCTVSLVKKAGAAAFGEYVLQEYKRQTGYDAKVYETEISDGIVIQKL